MYSHLQTFSLVRCEGFFYFVFSLLLSMLCFCLDQSYHHYHQNHSPYWRSLGWLFHSENPSLCHSRSFEAEIRVGSGPDRATLAKVNIRVRLKLIN
ncbi:hypothetical protein BpHYR1_035737 [Brachionus plicatilis]|uniref:Uncharacterized protein n=1 Tax=Brachionus plicatilis TaxID=10195 RepID=A0A3M7PPZ7_BRAPC|nr:hypothetical protein BpHYR1_035737 [Brachionus plicatilis]